MKLKVGDFDVLDSGSIVGNLNESIDFILDTEIIKILRFIFVNDDSKKEPSVIAKKSKAENKTIELIFTNFNNTTGTGNTTPLPFAKYENRSLFLNYRVFHLEGGGKHIHYT